LTGQYYLSVGQGYKEKEKARDEICACLNRAEKLSKEVVSLINRNSAVKEAFSGGNKASVPAIPSDKPSPVASVEEQPSEVRATQISGVSSSDPVAECIATRASMGMVGDYYADEDALKTACQAENK